MPRVVPSPSKLDSLAVQEVGTWSHAFISVLGKCKCTLSNSDSFLVGLEDYPRLGE